MADPDLQAIPYIFGCSVIGPLHVQMNLPCQDACAFETFAGGLIIAVADGLGSASCSQVGARVAVETAVASAKSALSTENGSNVVLSDVLQGAVLAAREALVQRAAEEQCTLRDLACTIIVVASHDSEVAVAHIGDGAVVARTQQGLELASGPGASEYTNEVCPLTAMNWQESLRLVPTLHNVECVAVFTDGCQRAAFRKSAESLEPFSGFFGPLFSYAREESNQPEATAELERLLSSKKLCENSEDDKTLVVAVLTAPTQG